MADGLVAFLGARLDEAAATAWAVHDVSKCDALLYEEDMADAAARTPDCDCGYPACVLREVEAKRAILAEHDPCYPTYYPTPSGQPTCGVCHSGGWDWDPERWPCATVRILAAVYSDHPDCRPEWTV